MSPASKRLSIAIVAASALALFGAFAASAYASPTKTTACTGCHSIGGGVTVTATKGTATTANTTYSVKVAPSGTDGWAVFSGSTKIAYGSGATGSFTVANGATYTVYGVVNGGNSARTTVSPTAPMPMYRVAATYMMGSDRYQTCLQLVKQNFTGPVPAVVLATGANYPDALSAAPLAKAYGGPILLVAPGGALASDIKSEIAALKPARIFIVGSEAAVSAGAAADAGTLAPVTRLGGVDRFDTARLVAAQVVAKAGKPSRVVIANGAGYADALAAAPVAAKMGWPILLTKPTMLPTSTIDAMRSCGATSSLIVGGPTNVDPSLEASLPAPMRIAGGTRYETGAKLADFAKSLGMTYGTLSVTVGNNYPDALSAGPMVAKMNGILLLVPPTGPIPTMVAGDITANKAACGKLVVVGGSLPATQVTAIQQLLN